MAFLSFVAALALSPVAGSATVTPGIVYKTVAGNELALDLYRPANNDNVPVVVVIHGGSWSSGKREDMAPICEAIVASGMAAATVSYRLSPANKWPAHLYDCQAAVRFLRGNAAKYHLDVTKMGSCGGSAGGHLALLLGMRDTVEQGSTDYPNESSRVQAVFNIFGPVDVAQDFNKAIAASLAKTVMGVDYEKADAEKREFSPITYIKSGVAPVFTMHGLADPLVPVMQANRLSQAYSKIGVECVTYLVPKLGHGVDMKNPACVQALKDGVAFLKRQLTGS